MANLVDIKSINPHYDPNDFTTVRLVRAAQAAAAGEAYAQKMGITQAIDDDPADSELDFLVDCQIDFCMPNGALYVEGAEHDMRRTVEYIYRNVGRITHIVASLDSHYPIQIFSPLYWDNRKTGRAADPWTEVHAAEYGKVFVPRFSPDFDPNWNRNYISALNQGQPAKKELMLWPLHCLIGTTGYALVPQLAEAIIFWAAARKTNPDFKTKGSNLFTEHYSPLEAEVKVPNDYTTLLDTDFLSYAEQYARINVFGEAKSHCVDEFLNSSFTHFQTNAQHMIDRVNIMVDCMSDVIVRNPADGSVIFDYSTLSGPKYDSYERLGAHLVNSTDY